MSDLKKIEDPDETLEAAISKAEAAINAVLENKYKSAVYQRCYCCGCIILPMEGWKIIKSHRADKQMHMVHHVDEFWHTLCWNEFERTAEAVDVIKCGNHYENSICM